jgi:hypothetical protein
MKAAILFLVFMGVFSGNAQNTLKFTILVPTNATPSIKYFDPLYTNTGDSSKFSHYEERTDLKSQKIKQDGFQHYMLEVPFDAYIVIGIQDLKTKELRQIQFYSGPKSNKVLSIKPVINFVKEDLLIIYYSEEEQGYKMKSFEI